MKKALALTLSIIMIFSLFSLPCSAAAQEAELTEYPVIIVPGYTSTAMYRIDEEGNKVMAWGDIMGLIGGGFEKNGKDLLSALIKSLQDGTVDTFAEKIGVDFNWIFSHLACNPDGTSVVPLYPYVHTAEETNYAELREKYPEGDYQAEGEIAAGIAEKVGYENMYVFTCDFRMGAIELSDSLKEYIDDVLVHANRGKAESEKVDKVNIFAVSHGGQVTGTYLTRYGHEGKVNNAVLTVPALGGAGVAYDLFNATTDFSIVDLIVFLEHGMIFEEDLHLFVDTLDLSIGDSLVAAAFPIMMETIKYWGSLWDFIPLEYYEEMKAKLLDEEKDAGLIAKSDKMHYEIMSPDGENYYAKGFKKAQETGTDIYIMAGYDCLLFTGEMKESSDALITANASTGATCAPYGKRFADGYTQKVDTGIYQVSPSMTVDASTAYLPFQTWLIEGYHHGMTLMDDYTISLAETLLLTEKSYDVNSMEEYPQFHATTNASNTIHTAFNNSSEGYLTKKDTALVVTNLSAKHNVVLMNIVGKGLDLDLDFKPVILGPGEKLEIDIKGEIPDVSLYNFELTLSYFTDSLSLVGERTFDFTALGGAPVVYDIANPLVNADFTQKIDEVISEDADAFLRQYGLKDVATIIYNMFYQIIELVVKIVNIGK